MHLLYAASRLLERECFRTFRQFGLQSEIIYAALCQEHRSVKKATSGDLTKYNEIDRLSAEVDRLTELVTKLNQEKESLAVAEMTLGDFVQKYAVKQTRAADAALYTAIELWRTQHNCRPNITAAGVPVFSVQFLSENANKIF
jgi:cell division protein FtsB